MSVTEPAPPTDFIRTIITEDLKNNKNDGRVHTRLLISHIYVNTETG